MSRRTILATLLAASLPASAADAPAPSAPATSSLAARATQALPAVKTSVKATLEAVENAHGRTIVKMTAKNVGPAPISFLDTAEGSFTGDHFWDIQVKISDGQLLSPRIKYAALGRTTVVTLWPGETYTREFSINAYVSSPSPPPAGHEQAALTIRYRTANLFEYEERMLAPPYLSFATEPLTIALRDHL